MKKSISLILILCTILFVLSGCSNSPNTQAYEKAAKDFITSVYTFEDADKILDQNDFGVATEKAYNSLKTSEQEFAWHEVLDTIKAAFNNKSKISVKNIYLSYYNKISETGAMVYNFTADIVATPFKEGSIKEFELTGQIQIIKIENTYKIRSLSPDGDQKWGEFSLGLLD